MHSNGNLNTGKVRNDPSLFFAAQYLLGGGGVLGVYKSKAI